MSPSFPHLSLLARVLVTCLTLFGLGMVGNGAQTGQVATLARAVGPSPDVLVAALERDAPQDTLARMTATAPTSAPRPTPAPPTAVPKPEPPLEPQWGRLQSESLLRLGPEPNSAAAQFLPRGSYLKLLESRPGAHRVYYGGNGDDHDPQEGWINAADVAVSGSPKWVEASQPAVLWSGPTGDGQAGVLPRGAVAEVLEDRGRRLHVFYLGDGLSRKETEGWANVADLGPAGPMIVSERWGLRLLSRGDVEAINAGQGVWLRVPFRSQLDGSPSADANCGPSSVAMTLQFFSVAMSNSEVRNLADRLQGTSDPEGGFAIEYLRAAAERLGMTALDLGPDHEHLRRWTTDDLRRHLQQGHPIIVQLRFRAMPGRELSTYEDDHYVVIDGMLGDDFIYNDSVDADGPGYGRVISSEDLKLAWGTSYFPFAAFAVAAPR